MNQKTLVKKIRDSLSGNTFAEQCYASLHDCVKLAQKAINKREITTLSENIGTLRDIIKVAHISACRISKEKITVKQIEEEIRVVKNRWKTFISEDSLCTVITDVVLSEDGVYVNFGDFLVKVPLYDLYHYTIEPYGNNQPPISGHYHPNIGDDNFLCEGEAEYPIKIALQQGRLEDFFAIIETTLRTYGSPYVSLHSWADFEECYSCGEGLDIDSRIYCDKCNAVCCDNCLEYHICDKDKNE